MQRLHWSFGSDEFGNLNGVDRSVFVDAFVFRRACCFQCDGVGGVQFSANALLSLWDKLVFRRTQLALSSKGGAR